MKPKNYRIPVATVERKPTVDELYLQALREKHECLAELIRANFSTEGPTMRACHSDYDAAIEHYKKLAWKEER